MLLGTVIPTNFATQRNDTLDRLAPALSTEKRRRSVNVPEFDKLVKSYGGFPDPSDRPGSSKNELLNHIPKYGDDHPLTDQLRASLKIIHKWLLDPNVSKTEKCGLASFISESLDEYARQDSMSGYSARYTE